MLDPAPCGSPVTRPPSMGTMTAPTLPFPDGASLSPLARLVRDARAHQHSRTSPDGAADRLTLTMTAGDLFGPNAEGWNGPLPKSGTGQGLRDVLHVHGEIERTFVSRNLIRDVVRRHRSSFREPLWSVVPRRIVKKGEALTSDEQRTVDEFTAALTDWWDEGGVWPAVTAALDTALSVGTGYVRLYIHASATEAGWDEQGRPARVIPAGLSLSEVLRRISIHAPAWEQAGVVRDLDGHVTGSYYTRAEGEGRTRWEVQERLAGGTVVHPNMDAAGGDLEPPVLYPVPDTLIYELRLPRIVTDSIKRLSRMANKTLTMGSRNVDLGGFLERTILNAQMPGEIKTLADGTRKFIPDTYNVGAGVTNFLSGKSLYVEDPEQPGKMKPSGNFATPSVIYKDPTAFSVFGEAFDKAREMILDEANQLHVLIAGDASASGVSRQQAVNDFLASLEPTRIALEGLLRWLLDAALRLGLHFTGRTGELEPYRVRAQARIHAVQPTPAEVDMALRLHEAGLLTEEDALQRAGTEDVDATRATRAAEGITPALALRLLPQVPTWVGLRALMLAFPALNISEQDVAAQREIDLAAPVDLAEVSESDTEPDPENVSPEGEN